MTNLKGQLAMYVRIDFDTRNVGMDDSEFDYDSLKHDVESGEFCRIIGEMLQEQLFGLPDEEDEEFEEFLEMNPELDEHSKVTTVMLGGHLEREVIE